MSKYRQTLFQMRLISFTIVASLFLMGNQSLPKKELDSPAIVVLGIAQDAGFPQSGCKKECCSAVWKNHAKREMVSCLAIVDPKSKQFWLIDATPDFKDQLYLLQKQFSSEETFELSGIFLTHGHIGHYTGLMHLGREVMGAKELPVYGMPRMQKFLSTNGPWQQLVTLKNIALQPMTANQPVALNERLTITPFLVPHRDEYTETVGYRIDGLKKSAIFIPDIDKWEKWEQKIESMIADVDVAYLDGTFYADGEIPGRNMAEIPHPFIRESMARFEKLVDSEKQKIVFIHLNHTNPALQKDSEASRQINAAGFRVAEMLEVFKL